MGTAPDNPKSKIQNRTGRQSHGFTAVNSAIRLPVAVRDVTPTEQFPMSGTMIQSGWRVGKTPIAAAAPLVLLPAIACMFLPRLAEWQAMWLLAISIYAGLKLLTLADCPLVHRASIGRIVGYLLLWPGMDVKAFLDPNARVAQPKARNGSLQSRSYRSERFCCWRSRDSCSRKTRWRRGGSA